MSTPRDDLADELREWASRFGAFPEALRALLREAADALEVPICETCEGTESVLHGVAVRPKSLHRRPCPSCGGTGRTPMRTHDEWVAERDPLGVHVIEFRNNGWTIQHPLRERLDGSLFDCDMAIWLGGDIGYRGRYVLNENMTLGDRVEDQ